MVRALYRNGQVFEAANVTSTDIFFRNIVTPCDYSISDSGQINLDVLGSDTPARSRSREGARRASFADNFSLPAWSRWQSFQLFPDVHWLISELVGLRQSGMRRLLLVGASSQ